MAIGTALAIGGAAAGLLGAKKQADAQRDAANTAADAAAYRPSDVYTPGGNVRAYEGSDGRFTFRSALNDNDQLIRNLLNQQGQQYFGGQAPTSLFGQQIMQQGANQLPGLYQGAQDASQQLPLEAFARQQGVTSNLGNLASQQATGLFGQASQQPNQGLAQLLSGQGLGATGQALNMLGQSSGQGFLNQAAGVDLNSARGMLSQAGGNLNPSQAMGFLSQSQNALAGIPQDMSGLVDDRLSLLREQAAPQEERQFNSLQNRLFSQGRLGSTGGSRDIEAFARGLGQADLGRQMQAQNLGMAAQQQQANIGLGQAGALQGLAGTAQNIGTSTAGTLGSLAGQLGGLNLQEAGLFSNLAQQSSGLDLSRAAAQAGIGQSLLGQAGNLQGLDLNRQANLLGAGQGLLGLGGNLASQGLTGATNLSNMANQRAMQRMANAQGLFGFGRDIGAQDFNRGLAALQGQQTMDTMLQNQMRIAAGSDAGSPAQAQALLQTGQSPGGAMLSGLGQSAMSLGMSGLFGGGNDDGLELMNVDYSGRYL